MQHTVISFVFQISRDSDPDLLKNLENISQDPAENALLPFKDLPGVHYASLVVFKDEFPPKRTDGSPGKPRYRPYLVAEFNCDENLDQLLNEIDGQVYTGFDTLLRHCDGYPAGGASKQELRTFMRRHALKPSAWHVGNVGVSVDRVKKEAELRVKAGDYLDSLGKDLPASGADIHKLLVDWATEKHPWVFLPEPRQTPTEKAKPQRTINAYIGLGLVLAAIGVWHWKKTWPIIPALALGYALLRHKEKTDVEQTDPADPDWVLQQELQEDKNRQNHLSSLIVVKPGPLRHLLLRAVLWATNLLARTQTQGQLGGITTIHFAHWALVDHGNLLLFFSNYDNSWGSYLDDFTDKANVGLTSIWSNTELFPHTTNLINDGATNGVRFKAWARMRMTTTDVWYQAYKDLSVGRILRNSEFREGFQQRLSGKDLDTWLALLGGKSPADAPDAIRPAPYEEPAKKLIPALEKLKSLQENEFDDIQGIVISAYSNLSCADYILLAIDDPEKERITSLAHQWLMETAEKAAYTLAPGTSYDKEAPAINVALTKEGLLAFGLTEDELKTFSIPFQQGMTSEHRRAVLGDVERNAPEKWKWHNPASEEPASHILLMLFAASSPLREELVEAEKARWQAAGLREVALLPGARQQHTKEPFGFVDGIGQPVIKGSPREGKQKERTGKETVINAGEFVLGYTNEDNVPAPGPLVADFRDGKGYLEPAHLFVNGKYDKNKGYRDLGLNGTYLVFRQLSQDVEKFNQAMEIAAATGRHKDPEYYAAKVVGRWKSGASLVQYPDKDPNIPIEELPDSNNFLFRPTKPKDAVWDSAGLRCPMGSHIRRSNPRDSLGDTPWIAVQSARRHRLLRRGRVYDPDVAAGTKLAQDQGLQFICLSADIERQFEFVQQTWINNPSFAGLSNEVDPIMGEQPDDGGPMTIPDEPVREKICCLSDFVTVKGGGYFFLPSGRALRFLASLRP